MNFPRFYKNKEKAITSANAPKNKKEIQKFLGHVNYLRRFISNLTGKTKEFSDLVMLKDMEEFTWEERHQVDFDKIKEYISKPSVLMPPIQGHPLKLYLSIVNESIGCLLAENNSKGHEQVVYHLSRVLNPT